MAGLLNRRTILVFLLGSLLHHWVSIEARTLHTINIKYPQLFPEGFDWDKENQHFIVGSLQFGTLHTVSDAGVAEDFIKDKDYAGKASILGITVDSKRSRVLAVIHRPADPNGESGFNALAGYDLKSGKRVLFVELDQNAAANDVAVDPYGNAFVTNSAGNFIWKVTIDGHVSVFAKDPIFTSQDIIVEDDLVRFCGLNGIVYNKRGALLVTQSNSGKLFEVDLHDGSVRLVQTSKTLPWADGIIVRRDGVALVVSHHTAWFLKTRDNWAEATVVDEVPLNASRFATAITLREDDRAYVLNCYLLDSVNKIGRDVFSIEEIEFPKEASSSSMSFSTRRAKPRKIAINDASSSDSESPVVKKPPPKKTPANVRPKPKASSRLSFGGAAAADEADEFQIKKSALSRRAMERSAARKSLGAVGVEKLTIAPERERVSYSKEYLEELKSAQMVASAATEEEEDAVMVDLGEDDAAMLDLDGATIVQTGESSAAGGTQIMDEGLVRVMKARRQERAAAAKAGAGDYISLHDDDDGGGEIMLRPKKKKESRLVARDDFADDEEIANYVDDAERVLLTNSKSARREQERRRKQMIRATIAEAEGADDDVDGDSDVSRDSLVEEWERDQIRKGAFTTEHAASGLEGELEALARNPPAATQLPDIKDVVARLEATLRSMEIRKASTERQIEMLIQEKKEIRDREEMVQTRLKEAGEQYEKLKKETNIGGAGPEGVMDRGLESFGNTPIKVSTDD